MALTELGKYTAFWAGVGKTFPSLKEAASTRYYFQCEQELFDSYFPPLENQRILKTDLWDEAKNTEILRWAAAQGARPFGVDIAPDVVVEAREVLVAHSPGFVVADVRALPFRDRSFDLVYSMGTIEHFPESDIAMVEVSRVMRGGGTAIIGVPNRLDPFLRPLMVHLMNLLGLYSYGMERSFSPGALRRLVGDAGLQPVAMSGILFMPGWLRILDLVFHTRQSMARMVTAPLVGLFARLYRHVPAVRRHGYLIACVATKPKCHARKPTRRASTGDTDSQAAGALRNGGSLGDRPAVDSALPSGATVTPTGATARR